MRRGCEKIGDGVGSVGCGGDDEVVRRGGCPRPFARCSGHDGVECWQCRSMGCRAAMLCGGALPGGSALWRCGERVRLWPVGHWGCAMRKV